MGSIAIAAAIILAAVIVTFGKPLAYALLKGKDMAQLDDLLAKLTDGVTNDTTVHSSVKTFIANLQSQLTDAQTQLLTAGVTADQMSKLQAAIDALKANDDDLAAAVTANTPVENPS